MAHYVRLKWIEEDVVSEGTISSAYISITAGFMKTVPSVKNF